MTNTKAAKTLTSAAALDWEVYEGKHMAYSETGAHVIEIGALQDRGQAHKWGEDYLPGRSWTVFHEDVRVITGGPTTSPPHARRLSLNWSKGARDPRA